MSQIRIFNLGKERSALLKLIPNGLKENKNAPIHAAGLDCRKDGVAICSGLKAAQMFLQKQASLPLMLVIIGVGGESFIINLLNALPK